MSGKDEKKNASKSFVELGKDVIGQVARCLLPIDFLMWKRVCKNNFELLNTTDFWQNADLMGKVVCHMVLYQKRNVLLTGPGGTGKTFTLTQLLEMSKKTSKKVAITATTGLAASLFEGGVTIHSFAGLLQGHVKLEKIRDGYASGRWKPGYKNFNNYQVLIIDEVSMLGDGLFDKLDLTARLARNVPDKPFGGMQLVLCGDFLQLPPIGASFAFESKVWKQLNLVRIDAQVPVRQSDVSFFELLSRIRTCRHTAEDVAKLKKRLTSREVLETRFANDTFAVRPTQIFCKNKQVEAVNMEEFSKLTTKIDYTSPAQGDTVLKKVAAPSGWKYEPTFDISLVDARKKVDSNVFRQAPDLLQFRQGAQYILTKNLSVKNKLVNGSRCVYLGERRFKFLHQKDPIMIGFTDFFFPIHGGYYFSRRQMPLRLGYAVSCHGSQGMSLDSAIIDIGADVFSHSQAYVALSRVRSLESLYLLKFDEKRIRAHPSALRFYNTFQKVSRKLPLPYAKLQPVKKRKIPEEPAIFKKKPRMTAIISPLL